jgi:hypothetical protein
MEAHADIVAVPAVKRSRTVRLLTAAHLDRRTRASKRARSIAAELEQSFGGEVTKVQRQAIERAAVLSVIAEHLGACRLAGQAISLDDLLRAEGCAKRAIQAILAERPPKPRGLQRARARWEADEKAKAAQAAEEAGEATATDNTEPPDVRVE